MDLGFLGVLLLPAVVWVAMKYRSRLLWRSGFSPLLSLAGMAGVWLFRWEMDSLKHSNCFFQDHQCKPCATQLCLGAFHQLFFNQRSGAGAWQLPRALSPLWQGGWSPCLQDCCHCWSFTVGSWGEDNLRCPCAAKCCHLHCCCQNHHMTPVQLNLGKANE